MNAPGAPKDDISCHCAIDCFGNVYEGRDIRFNGGHLAKYNAGAIGIVLLENLIDPGEGSGFGSCITKCLFSKPSVPEDQAISTKKLILILKEFFDIRQFGGHREFPKKRGQNLSWKCWNFTCQQNKKKFGNISAMRKLFSMVFVVFFLLLSWLHIGVAKDSFSEESYSVIFIKKHPTFQVVFINSTLTESDVLPFSEWEKDRLAELKDYCRYRFGVTDLSESSLVKCAERPHRSRNWLTEWYVGT